MDQAAVYPSLKPQWRKVGRHAVPPYDRCCLCVGAFKAGEYVIWFYVSSGESFVMQVAHPECDWDW